MASASASSSRLRSSGARGRPASAPQLARVRWDRLGRAAMLCVLAVLLYLYVSAGVRVLETWRQSGREGATVAALQREHQVLTREHSNLTSMSTLEAEARRLGMMKHGEQPYVVTGLPAN